MFLHLSVSHSVHRGCAMHAPPSTKTVKCGWNSSYWNAILVLIRLSHQSLTVAHSRFHWQFRVKYNCNSILNCPLTFLHQKSQCYGSQGYWSGYSPNLYLVQLLRARIHWLVLSPTDVARYVMSNTSSQTSGRWHM